MEAEELNKKIDILLMQFLNDWMQFLNDSEDNNGLSLVADVRNEIIDLILPNINQTKN